MIMRSPITISLILLSFIIGFSNEFSTSSLAEEVSISNGEQSAPSTVKSNECENCHEDGCHDHKTHCSHHCSGFHNLIVTKQKIKFDHETGIDNKVLWYFDFHYDEPFLDPALKPPLFS